MNLCSRSRAAASATKLAPIFFALSALSCREIIIIGIIMTRFKFELAAHLSSCLRLTVDVTLKQQRRTRKTTRTRATMTKAMRAIWARRATVRISCGCTMGRGGGGCCRNRQVQFLGCVILPLTEWCVQATSELPHHVPCAQYVLNMSGVKAGSFSKVCGIWQPTWGKPI